MSFSYQLQKAFRQMRPKMNFEFMIGLKSIAGDRVFITRTVTASGRSKSEALKAAREAFMKDLSFVTLSSKKVRKH